jgi:uncharacterized protein
MARKTTPRRSMADSLSGSPAGKIASKGPAAPAGIGMRNATIDGLQNVLTGMGTEKDKSFNTFFGLSLMERSQLDAAYRGDWIARKGIDIPAYDSVREWRTWQADPDDVTSIEDTEKKFSLQLKLMKAMVYGRLYGGGALVMGVNQGQPEDELDVDKIEEGQLQFIHVVSRYDLSSGPIEWDIRSPYYGEPQYYEPTQRATANGADLNVRMHPSRIVRFTGNDIPDIAQAQGWGDSVLQSVSDAVIGAGTTTSSIAQMVAEAKIDVIKIPGLSENITSKEYETNLKARFAFANVAKSVFGLLLLDKEEEWERIEAQFAGLPDVLKTYLMIVSGAWDIPSTRFLSQSPQGMSATGESDIRNFYDRLSNEQKIVVEPKMCRLDKVILRSTLGNVPEDEVKDMWFTWNPLWQLSAKEKSEVDKAKADTFKIDVDAGLLNEVVLKKAREAQLIADGTYPGLQQIIDEYDDDPELEAAALEAEQMTAQLGAPPITDPDDPAYDPTKDPNAPEFQPQQVQNAPAKQLPPPSKAQSKAKAGKKNAEAVDGIVRRLADATRPRTLYVRRDLVNVREFRKWARSQGFATTVSDPHVTIMYSKAPVDWLKIGADEFRTESDGGLVVKAGGPRVIERFNSAVVLAFANSDIQYRHRSMMYRGEDDGIEWAHDDFTPHVTVTYDAGAVDLEQVKPYVGELIFGPEIFEEIKGPGFVVTEDYNENHDPANGQFASGAGTGGDPKDAGEGGRTDLVRSIAASDKPVNELHNEHQLTSGELRYLKTLRKRRKRDTADALPAPAPAPVVVPAPNVHIDVHVTPQGKVTKTIEHDSKGRVSKITETPDKE